MTDDLISRQAVLKQLRGCLTGGETEYQYVKLHIDSIPSVNPQEPNSDIRLNRVNNELNRDKNEQEPKTGHWTHDGSHWKNRFICSECGYKLFEEQTNYCPNCGCRMVEPQESEE